MAKADLAAAYDQLPVAAVVTLRTLADGEWLNFGTAALVAHFDLLPGRQLFEATATVLHYSCFPSTLPASYTVLHCSSTLPAPAVAHLPARAHYQLLTLSYAA